MLRQILDALERKEEDFRKRKKKEREKLVAEVRVKVTVKVTAKKRRRRRLAGFAGQNRRVKPFTRYVTKESEFASPATHPATFHSPLSFFLGQNSLPLSLSLSLSFLSLSLAGTRQPEPWKVYIFPCRKSSSLVSRVLFNDRR